MPTISLPILSGSSLGLCSRLSGGRGRGLCVWLPSGDAQPLAGPAESGQHPVWWSLLAGPPPLPQAAGPQHNAEPLQRQRHAAAVPLLGPPVQPGPPGEQRHRAACLRSLGALRTLQADRWVLAHTHFVFDGKMVDHFVESLYSFIRWASGFWDCSYAELSWSKLNNRLWQIFGKKTKISKQKQNNCLA